ncbi:MAG: GNAT family N-acetyltransferase [bacterium]
MVELGVHAVRSDGRLIEIRRPRPEDRIGLLELDARSSDRSIYLRFFSANRRVADGYVETVLRSPGPGHDAVVALTGQEIVGVASYERTSADEAEVALLVDDPHQHLGIGTLLLEHLCALARAAGLRRFTAETLAENFRMLGVFDRFGFAVHRETDYETVHVTCSLLPDDAAIDAIGERERSADVASLAAVLAPRSVVVVGAGRRARTVGYELLHNILAGGFAGDVYAVNRHGGLTQGLTAHRSVRDLPQPVDLAIVAVPAGDVLGVVRDCGQRGVRAVVLVSAGFGELGAAGRAMQAAILAEARRFGMRLVGPNCLGLVNTDPAVRLDATFAPLPGLAGPLGLISQSGALGIAVLQAAARCGIGVSQFVSVGNKADVSGNDLLLYWEQDPRTQVLAMYLESFGNPRRFARIARRVSRHKPILVLKAGRSAAGQRAGLSHTAAAASSDAVVDALFDQAGVVRMNTIEEILDATRVLSSQPLPAGSRVAVIGNSGGPGILAADAAVAGGLDVPALSPAAVRAVALAAPDAASWTNPIDLGAAAQPQAVRDSLRVLLDCGEVDAVLAVFVETLVADADELLAAIDDAATETAIPVVVTMLARQSESCRDSQAPCSPPVFGFPEQAARALAVARRYAVLRDRPIGAPVIPDGMDRDGVAARIADLVPDGDSSEEGRWLSGVEGADLLRGYGVPVSGQRCVTSSSAAVAAAAELGYPVAVKIARGDVVHKSDRGGVVLGLTDAEAVSRAYRAVVDACGDGDPAVLLQPMTPAGTELIVGAVEDDQFGPIIMLGAGGVLSDLLDDRTFRLLPLTDVDAADMIDRLRMAPLFDGFRGLPPVSRDVVRDLLHRVAAFVEDHPQVAELDLNPVVCVGANLVAVDVKVRLRPATPRADPLLRQLRPLVPAPTGR